MIAGYMVTIAVVVSFLPVVDPAVTVALHIGECGAVVGKWLDSIV
jgi:hypothetical protein